MPCPLLRHHAPGPCNWGDLSARYDPASRKLQVSISLLPHGSRDELVSTAEAGAGGAAELPASSAVSMPSIPEMPPPAAADDSTEPGSDATQGGAKAQAAAAPVTPQVSVEAEVAAEEQSSISEGAEAAAPAEGGEAEESSKKKKKNKKKKKKKKATGAAAEGVDEEQEEEEAAEPATREEVAQPAQEAEQAPQEQPAEASVEAVATPAAAPAVAASAADAVAAPVPAPEAAAEAAEEAPAIRGRTELGAALERSLYRWATALELRGGVQGMAGAAALPLRPWLVPPACRCWPLAACSQQPTMTCPCSGPHVREVLAKDRKKDSGVGEDQWLLKPTNTWGLEGVDGGCCTPVLRAAGPQLTAAGSGAGHTCAAVPTPTPRPPPPDSSLSLPLSPAPLARFCRRRHALQHLWRV